MHGVRVEEPPITKISVGDRHAVGLALAVAHVVVDQFGRRKEACHGHVVGRLVRHLGGRGRLVELGHVVVRVAVALGGARIRPVPLVQPGAKVDLHHLHVVVVPPEAQRGAHVAPEGDGRRASHRVGHVLVSRRAAGPKPRPVAHVRRKGVDPQQHRCGRHVVLLPACDEVRRVRSVRGRVDVPNHAIGLALHPDVTRSQRAAPAREHGVRLVHDRRGN